MLQLRHPNSLFLLLFVVLLAARPARCGVPRLSGARNPVSTEEGPRPPARPCAACQALLAGKIDADTVSSVEIVQQYENGPTNRWTVSARAICFSIIKGIELTPPGPGTSDPADAKVGGWLNVSAGAGHTRHTVRIPARIDRFRGMRSVGSDDAKPGEYLEGVMTILLTNYMFEGRRTGDDFTEHDIDSVRTGEGEGGHWLAVAWYRRQLKAVMRRGTSSGADLWTFHTASVRLLHEYIGMHRYSEASEVLEAYWHRMKDEHRKRPDGQTYSQAARPIYEANKANIAKLMAASK